MCHILVLLLSYIWWWLWLIVQLFFLYSSIRVHIYLFNLLTLPLSLSCSVCYSLCSVSVDLLHLRLPVPGDAGAGHHLRRGLHPALLLPGIHTTIHYAIHTIHCIHIFNQYYCSIVIIKISIYNTTTIVNILYTCLSVCLQLVNEDYRWWWRSFLHAGSCAFYTALYAVWYHLTELEMTGLVPVLLYYGYMSIICFTFFLVTGKSSGCYYVCIYTILLLHLPHAAVLLYCRHSGLLLLLLVQRANLRLHQGGLSIDSCSSIYCNCATITTQYVDLFYREWAFMYCSI